jgi:hypothetical protein
MRTSVVVEGPAGLALETPTVRFVGAPGDDVVATARREARAGADRIELCGGLGVVPHAAVRATVGVPVGVVTFGFESLDAAAAYKAAFAAGEPVRAAFLYPGRGERVDRDGTAIVPVDGPGDAVATAAALLAEGVTLLELYGGLGPEVAAAVATAVDGRGAVVTGAARGDQAGSSGLAGAGAAPTENSRAKRSSRSVAP